MQEEGWRLCWGAYLLHFSHDCLHTIFSI